MGFGTTCFDDFDSDTWLACEDCDDNDPNNYKGNAEDCDGKDNNCNGEIDEGCEMCAADIAPIAGGDCNADGDGNIGPDDLGELLANWGGRPFNTCADFAPVGQRDGIDLPRKN